MTGAKGCQDDFAAFVIFALNSLLLILTILGLVWTIYVWITQANLVDAEQALSVAIPDFILVLATFIQLVVLSIALLGIIATALQMKENKDIADGKKPEKPVEITVPKHAPGSKEEKEALAKAKIAAKKHPCCHLWGLAVYVLLCILAFFFLLAVSIVCGSYSDKMANFNSLDTVKDKGDAWIDTFETQLTDQVLTLAKKYPITWNKTQAAIGCCGWNVKNGTVTAFSNSECCHDSTVVTSVNVIGKLKADVSGCRKDGNDKVYTCEGIVATSIQGNLVKTSIGSMLLAIVQLALAICGCVVRYPKLFAYCDCKKNKNKNAVKPTEETPVQKFNVKPSETSGDMI